VDFLQISGARIDHERVYGTLNWSCTYSGYFDIFRDSRLVCWSKKWKGGWKNQLRHSMGESRSVYLLLRGYDTVLISAWRDGGRYALYREQSSCFCAPLTSYRLVRLSASGCIISAVLSLSSPLHLPCFRPSHHTAFLLKTIARIWAAVYKLAWCNSLCLV